MNNHFSYHIQDGCWNCIWLFLLKKYYSNEYYCTGDCIDRHLCNGVNEDWVEYIEETMGVSVKDGELFFKEHTRLSEEWENWAKSREVNQHGICDFYARRDD